MHLSPVIARLHAAIKEQSGANARPANDVHVKKSIACVAASIVANCYASIEKPWKIIPP